MKLKDIRQVLIGRAKNPFDPSIFRRISLVALLAWVGLGADGLSSSCYGPEHAFIGLQGNGFLVVYLAIATALTVAIIALSYTQIIEEFPLGGGGYAVATKLISPSAGLVVGATLIVDYVLTIAISVASGIDALFSFLPVQYHEYKIIFSVLTVCVLIILNLRGVKESISILLPIFAVFVLTHLVMVGLALFQHASGVVYFVADSIPQTKTLVENTSVWAVLFILLKAYTHGAGTYTGIEAVSNALPTLREPRVQTGKRAMFYMALSLTLLAGFILVFYGLFGIARVEGQTLNATLFERIVQPLDTPFGHWLVVLTLLSEAALLFIASQTGFIGGPQVLSNMALDQWMPRRFTHLNERLTVSNGIIFMGLGAVLIILLTKGSVAFLVVLYSISVFITFSLSQLGMCRHWLKIRGEKDKWLGKFAVNFTGFLLTTGILVILVAFQFNKGGWLTLLIIGGVTAVAVVIKQHYLATRRALKRLDDILVNVPRLENLAFMPKSVPKEAQTAVIMVSGYNGFGIHTFFSVEKLFPKIFKRVVFVSVGELDIGRFKGIGEVKNLKSNTEKGMKKYIQMANDFGFYAEYRYDVSVDTIETLVELCNRVHQDYPNSIFFSSKLVFKNESIFTQILHNETALRIQRRLALENKQTVVMPIRVY